MHFTVAIHISILTTFVSRCSGSEEDGGRRLDEERFQPVRQRYDKRA